MGKNFDNCPHCGKDYCILDAAWRNADVYGSSRSDAPCRYCEKPVTFYLRRTVVLDAPVIKSDKKPGELDW